MQSRNAYSYGRTEGTYALGGGFNRSSLADIGVGPDIGQKRTLMHR